MIVILAHSLTAGAQEPQRVEAMKAGVPLQLDAALQAYVKRVEAGGNPVLKIQDNQVFLQEAKINKLVAGKGPLSGATEQAANFKTFAPEDEMLIGGARPISDPRAYPPGLPHNGPNPPRSPPRPRASDCSQYEAEIKRLENVVQIQTELIAQLKEELHACQQEKQMPKEPPK